MPESISPLVPVVLPERIEAERIFLRAHLLKDAESMFRAVEGDRERFQKWLPWVKATRVPEDSASYIQSTLEKRERGEGFDYGLFRREDGAYLGNIGVHHVSWPNRRCEIGYWIRGEYEGQGFMSEAVRALEGVLFEAGFHRLEIHCSSLNERSAAVPRRCGYRLEATLKEHAIDHGKFRDTLLFEKRKSPRS